jgi:plastocyanin
MRKYQRMCMLLCLALGLCSAVKAAAAADLQVVARGSDGQPVADLVLYLTAAGGAPVPSTSSDAPVLIGQQDIQFTPRLSVVPVGAHISFVNHDDVAHHVFSFSEQAPENLELVVDPGGQSEDYVFAKQGFTKIGCNIHDNMSAFIFAAPSSLSAVSSMTGEATISNVPQGKFTLWVWSSAQLNVPLVQKDITVGGTAAPVAITIPNAKRQQPQRHSFDDY